jgi:hypothetical protein
MGTGFVAGATVRLVDVTHNQVFDPFDPTRTTVVNANQIQIRPNLTAAAATWTVQVRTPTGQVSNVVTFTVTPGTVGSPTISSVSPNPVPGLDGQQPVTLTGTGFVAGSTVRLVDVTHNQVFDPFDPTRTTVVNATQIQIRPNLTAAAATWTVQVRSPSGQVSNVATFTVTE